MTDRRIAVVGGGITGAAAAHRLVTRSDGDHLDEVVLIERSERVAGRIRDSAFAGLSHLDEGADAFLARVPDALDLADEVGLGDRLVHPEPVGAAVWYDDMHDIPTGLVLGVPGDLKAMALTSLLTTRGKARAAIEPLLPRSPTDHDSIGRYVRARFGNEVHERLVDALVGSIYAADTDHFSLAEIPQLAALSSERSLLLAARRAARRAAGTASAAAAPVFAAPRAGMSDLVESTVARFRDGGGVLRTGVDATVDASGARWSIAGDEFDAVILAVPADALSTTLPTVPSSSRHGDRSDVVMVTLHVADDEFPDGARGRSGYLVPKPVQRDVTAVSFASQKWAHWAPPGGGEILRVSLGRDGAPVLHLSDDEIVDRTLADVNLQLGANFSPIEVRITRWPGAFAQYRPQHRTWVGDVRSSLPPGVFVAGSSFDGIGIPACVRSGRSMADSATEYVANLPE